MNKWVSWYICVTFPLLKLLHMFVIKWTGRHVFLQIHPWGTILKVLRTERPGARCNEKVSLFSPDSHEIRELDVLQITKQVYFLDPIFTRRINRDRIFQINEKRGYEILAYDGEGSLIRCLLCPDQSAFVFQPGFLPHLRFGRKSIFRLYRRERKRLQAAEDFPVTSL